ncbi:MAG: GSCFA domain-containing protein [Bacteroidota bacterium]
MSTNFRTLIQHPTLQPAIGYEHKIMMLGSCFTQSIGTLFQNKQFDILINPFGITYNPLSIASSLERIIDAKPFTENDLICHQDVYCSLLHHGSFNSRHKEECLDYINTSLQIANETINKANYIFITLGTNTYFEHIEKSIIVNNCHKLSSKNFLLKKASVDQIVTQLGEALERIKSINPTCTFVFSISPIRYLQEGAFANTLNKSTLFLAIEKLMQYFSGSYYFPAYEIILDDLRDYRFYKEDMLHPNNIAIQYVWSFVETHLLSTSAKEIMKRIDKILLMKAHRPINEQSEEHKKFLVQIDVEIEQIKLAYPSIPFHF